LSRIAYVNGRYVNHRKAVVHIEDRGYQFADGVYEVCEVRYGYIVDLTRHLNRLERSLRELSIKWPMSRLALTGIIRETVRRNYIFNGMFYLQITRGVAKRDHVFPASSVRSSLVVTAKHLSRDAGEARAAKGIAVITVPDNRWDRVDIKSIGLLPNVMAREAAKQQGAQEAVYVDSEGFVKEGAATNVWIVSKDGKLITRPAESGILRGVTRTTVIDLATKLNLVFEERAFSVEEAKQAREVFITAATTLVMPVVQFDGIPIGNAYPGNVAIRLRDEFFAVAEKTLA
jgi:D-alanine transaminase